jgi:hypothetical protein
LLNKDYSIENTSISTSIIIVSLYAHYIAAPITTHNFSTYINKYAIESVRACPLALEFCTGRRVDRRHSSRRLCPALA